MRTIVPLLPAQAGLAESAAARQHARRRIARLDSRQENGARRAMEAHPDQRGTHAPHLLHIVHNFLVASREGIHLIQRDPSGKWTRSPLGDGSPG